MGIAESVGLSSSRLALLDRTMKERYVDSGLLPGILTMVYRGGQLVARDGERPANELEGIARRLIAAGGDQARDEPESKRTIARATAEHAAVEAADTRDLAVGEQKE